MEMVFVASIIRNELCIIMGPIIFFKIIFYRKLFFDCCDKFDYPGSIVYLSCFVSEYISNLADLVNLYKYVMYNFNTAIYDVEVSIHNTVIVRLVSMIFHNFLSRKFVAATTHFRFWVL